MKILFENKLLMILFATALAIALKMLSQFGLGYFPPGGLIFFALMFILSLAYYVAMLICVIAIARSTVNVQWKLFFTAILFSLAILGLIPKGHFVTLGALYSVNKNNPTDVVIDARRLMQEYEPMACFGFPERYPCDNPIPPTNLPLSIQKVYPEHVLILDNAVLIEKFGLGGIFQGFVVFPEEKDIWENEPPIQLQKSCNDCWKIRIIEGLYWYHAIKDYPIKSMFSAGN